MKMKQHIATPMVRRSFLKRVGIGGASLMPGSALLARAATNAPASGATAPPPTQGDIDILQFLLAAETLETDLWQQYNELALGNVPFLQALQTLDGDMPTYVNQNTRDEMSHAAFLSAYLSSLGATPVSLEAFRTLPSSQATGSNTSAKRLVNLNGLNVDTSWYLRYRSSGNPDFGDTFPQIVDLTNVPTIPDSDLPPPSDTTNGFQIQFIANAASWNFVFIEQGGSSLYESFLPKITSTEVVRVVGSIGGTEVQHFELWQDKAGNAPAVTNSSGQVLFPQLPVAPTDSNGETSFPGNGTDPSQPNFTNQVFPEPCTFISSSLPLCSVIRPTTTPVAGAVATVNAFKRRRPLQRPEPAVPQYADGAGDRRRCRHPPGGLIRVRSSPRRHGANNTRLALAIRAIRGQAYGGPGTRIENCQLQTQPCKFLAPDPTRGLERRVEGVTPPAGEAFRGVPAFPAAMGTRWNAFLPTRR